jgi:hypothetical protein
MSFDPNAVPDNPDPDAGLDENGEQLPARRYGGGKYDSIEDF